LPPEAAVRSRRGFTLIRLLVVMAIISIDFGQSKQPTPEYEHNTIPQTPNLKPINP
jgi:prepilin-type N-terminal cleavage/methylation domain-containing protein